MPLAQRARPERPGPPVQPARLDQQDWRDRKDRQVPVAQRAQPERPGPLGQPVRWAPQAPWDLKDRWVPLVQPAQSDRPDRPDHRSDRVCRGRQAGLLLGHHPFGGHRGFRGARLHGFGSSTVGVIDGSGESTSPPEAGGFAIPVAADGTIGNLQVSVDLLVASVVAINTLGLQYQFTVFRAPSVPNNGIDHPAASFVTTPLTTSVRFGFPNTIITAGTFRSATNLNLGTISVTAGDRIGIRVRTLTPTDPSAADVTQLSFSATMTYAPGS